MTFLDKGIPCQVVGKWFGDVTHPLGQCRLVAILLSQTRTTENVADIGLPRVVRPEPEPATTLQSAEGIAQRLLLGKEHQLAQSLHILGDAVVVAYGLVADSQTLQVSGMVEHMLADVGSLLRQDDGLQFVAVVEHILVNHVVLIDKVVETVALVRMHFILLQACVI